jgi:hypothetical protein
MEPELARRNMLLGLLLLAISLLLLLGSVVVALIYHVVES